MLSGGKHFILSRCGGWKACCRGWAACHSCCLCTPICALSEVSHLNWEVRMKCRSSLDAVELFFVVVLKYFGPLQLSEYRTTFPYRSCSVSVVKFAANRLLVLLTATHCFSTIFSWLQKACFRKTSIYVVTALCGWNWLLLPHLCNDRINQFTINITLVCTLWRESMTSFFRSNLQCCWKVKLAWISYPLKTVRPGV